MSIHRSILIVLAALAALTGGLVLASTPALAITEFHYQGALKTSYAHNSPSRPDGMAADGGDIWVANGEAVEEFDATNGLLQSLQSGAGHFSGVRESEGAVEGVAVDHATGKLLVAASGPSNVVDVFDISTGAFVSQWSGSNTLSGSFGSGFRYDGHSGGGQVQVAVNNNSISPSDPTAGDVYVAGGFGVIDLLNAEGEPVNFIGSASYIDGSQLNNPVGVGFVVGMAVDPNGDLYVAGQNGSSAVDEFAPSGVQIGQITGTPEGAFNSVGGVATDSTGNVYVLNEFGEEGVVDEFSATGAYLRQIADTPRGPLIRPSGVTVDATGKVYVGEEGNQGVAAVDVFTLVTLPVAVTGAPARSVTATSATVPGTIDPAGGLDAHYHFEYGLNATYSSGTTTPSDAGSLTLATPLEVSADLNGLEPNATYHYQLVGSAGEGEEPGGDQTFKTLPIAPSLDSQSVSGVTLNSAILNAAVNANNQDTKYYFEYDTSEYNTSAPHGIRLPVSEGDIGSGYGDVVVGQQLTGLQPGVTYHFRVVAANASSPAGGTIGPDQTFTTLRPLAPAVSTGAASAVAQNSASISGTVDPRGVQSTYEFDVGTDTSYGTRVFGDAGSGSEPQTITLPLQGLTPGTTYHYRLLASNVFGSTDGPDQTFTTPGFSSSLLVAPVASVLIPTPVFSSPSTTGITTAGTGVHSTPHKKQTKKKTKKKAKKKHKGSSAASRGHGKKGGK